MFGRQRAASPLALLRRIAGVSQRRLAREINVDVRIVKAIESDTLPMTPHLCNAIKIAFRDRGASDVSLTLLEPRGMSDGVNADVSRSDLGTIERYLSEISNKLGSLVNSLYNPGGDLKAVVNRLETANGHLSTISSNTRR